MTRYLDQSAKPLPASRLSVPRLFRDLLAGNCGSDVHRIIVARHGDNAGDLDAGAKSIMDVLVDKLHADEAAGIYAHLSENNQLLDGLTDAKLWETYVSTDGNVQKFANGLRAIAGTTSRGNVKKGRGRGVPQRADKVLSVTL